MEMNRSSVDGDWDPQTQVTSLECWDHSIELACLQGSRDLQLAAELGKTLLERNKELENTIKSQQLSIEEKFHEIEYMKKQTAALREVNDSRLRIYEQLEVSIQDLERANHLLVNDNTNDKKVIRNQSVTIESLEVRCDELQKKYDVLESLYQAVLRQQAANGETQLQAMKLWKESPSPDGSIQESAASNSTKSPYNGDSNLQQLVETPADDEEVSNLRKQLNEIQSQRSRGQKKITELEIQLASLLHENNALEDQLNVWRNKAQDVKNLQDELSTLEEVRQGHLCGRCLRGINMKTHEELTFMIDRNGDDIPEVDEIILDGSFVNSDIQVSDSLVQDANDKTEVMDEILGHACNSFVGSYKSFVGDRSFPATRFNNNLSNACMSLQDELKMSGEFNNFRNALSENHSGDETSNEKSCKKSKKFGKKPFSGTSTEFSEAETLSSGFADETSNKSTQTDGRPGSLLCSIADGDNCKLSIYDDNSALESHFNRTPEYRRIFSEISSVLKRAAESKTELSQVNDADTTSIFQNYVPVNDDIVSRNTDDSQSVISSIISSVVSEPVFRVRTHVLDKKKKHDLDGGKCADSALRPLQSHKRQQLDYLSIQTRKNTEKKNSPKKHNSEPPSTPDIIPSVNPKIMHAKSYSGGKRKFRPLTSSELDNGVWNGHTTHFYPSRNRDRRLNNSLSSSSNKQHILSYEYKDFKPSAASQEIAELKRLDLSYAEVLRMPNKLKESDMRRS